MESIITSRPANAFASIANLRLPTTARLLPTSWCPDKDLLAVILRTNNRDKLSLWKMQGAKKWEIGFDGYDPVSEEIVDLTWGTDGTSIALAHHPPLITLHSIENGHLHVSIPLILHHSVPPDLKRLDRIWWFPDPKLQTKSTMPDLFKRHNDITGSAFSILKTQPLLDPLHDELQALSSTELFTFQGVKPQASNKTQLPSIIATWPSLRSDPIAASLKPPKSGKQPVRPGEEYDEGDDSNTNSLLLVSDKFGDTHWFLDGCYAMGSSRLTERTTSLYQDSERTLLAFSQLISDHPFTRLAPRVLQLPVLSQRYLRDVARVTSSTKELTSYALRAVKEMRAAWFGSDTQSGARELGPKWLRGFEVRQREQFGESEANPMLDLTCLLVTGRASEALADYLGSNEQMSERGIMKWDQTVSEALIKLRDYSEKRLIPACQRLHLLLEEVMGWSQLPEYAFCVLKTDELQKCLNLTRTVVLVAGWLTATARRDLARFRDFLNWVRYEIARANPTTDVNTLPPPRHDPLEVNDYLMTGLTVSSLDRWFMGPVPNLSPEDLGIPTVGNLDAAIETARKALSDPDTFRWPLNVQQQDHSRLDRNLDALMQELATQCNGIFFMASTTVTRSAVVSPSPPPQPGRALEKQVIDAPALVREHTVDPSNHVLQQYLAIQTPHAEEGTYLCVIRLTCHYDVPEPTVGMEAAVLHCARIKNDEAQPIHLLDLEFFDEQDMIIVYRMSDSGPAYLATVNYGDIDYQAIPCAEGMVVNTREEVMEDVLRRVRVGELAPECLPINQTRELSGCREGRVTLSVNGRAGRRVSCVLDGSGLTLEIIDMEGGDDEEEEEGEGEDGNTSELPETEGAA